MTIKYCWRFYEMIEVVFLNKENKDYERYGKGSWVVVSGGSDGIGLGFAHRFASFGFNIILISRNESKLQDKCNEVQERFKVKAEYICMDAYKT